MVLLDYVIFPSLFQFNFIGNSEQWVLHGTTLDVGKLLLTPDTACIKSEDESKY